MYSNLVLVLHKTFDHNRGRVCIWSLYCFALSMTNKEILKKAEEDKLKKKRDVSIVQHNQEINIINMEIDELQRKVAGIRKAKSNKRKGY